MVRGVFPLFGHALAVRIRKVKGALFPCRAAVPLPAGRLVPKMESGHNRVRWRREQAPAVLVNLLRAATLAELAQQMAEFDQEQADAPTTAS
jgi:hypothetical protein